MSDRPADRPDPLGPFLHYLMAECGVSPNTLAAYRADIAKFIRWRKEHAPGPIERIDVPKLAGYVDYLSRLGLAPTSVGRHLASLSTFFRYLIFDGKLTENTAKLLTAPAVWDRLPTVLGPAAVDRLLSAPPAETRIGRRDRAALETLYATGCRASEVADLRPADLDLTSGSAALRRQGGQGAGRPARRSGLRGAPRVPPRRPPRARRAPARDAERVRLAVRPPAVPGRALEDRQDARPGRRPDRRRSARTPSGTASPPTSSPAAPTSASSRRCSATPRSPRPRFTPASS